MTQKITVVILTHNSEKTIEKCIRSVKWADYLVAIDDYSKDNTTKILTKHKVKTFSRSLNANFSAQRNFAFTKIKSEWVFFLDSDEYVSKDLESYIRKAISQEKYDGFVIKRKNVYKGKILKGGEWGNSLILRLGKKSKGKWNNNVHEFWDIKNFSRIEGVIFHQSFENFYQLLEKINNYQNIHFQAKLKNDSYVNLVLVVFFPLAKFIQNFIIKRGFLDGSLGFILSVFLAFHSFSAWSQLWLKKYTNY